MKHTKSYILALLLMSYSLIAQEELNYSEEEISINQFTDGTLTTPADAEATSLIIFVQGSGPTNRDGNQPMGNNDGMKKIARELAEDGIASFRFDKRIFKMNELKLKESDLKFEDFIKDVEDIISYFDENSDFDQLIIAGHSEGSLIGMLAAKKEADAFISLAGAGEPIDNILTEQISKMSPEFGEKTRAALDILKAEGKVANYDPMLESVFRPSVQPYLYSWIQYDPSEEIKELDMPILIINGTSDIQVDVNQAEMLKKANPESQLVILEDMNHVFRSIQSHDALTNTKSYNEPNREIHPQLVETISTFVKSME
ncbi:alpha/beta hydrolase [Gramella sp. AN32]|uniref:Alpha/beta hydrolase family protein n=1 Tax=Christiangramia antarctica TaxID=2058158 RepID=A0ABW5X5U6_9FLAO|nr:alpha/beta hydrolase [Gramella sp. AN32]MCM4154620.1 alpha/beta hydrolase [Gramella sp. AN32]